MAAPGNNVAAKQALNRSLLSAALGRLQHWVCVKAEEAGRVTRVVPAVNTSRTCASCGHCHVTNRVTRDRFVCQSCGHTAHADRNAAENIAALGQQANTAWQPRLRRSAPAIAAGSGCGSPGRAAAPKSAERTKYCQQAIETTFESAPISEAGGCPGRPTIIAAACCQRPARLRSNGTLRTLRCFGIRLPLQAPLRPSPRPRPARSRSRRSQHRACRYRPAACLRRSPHTPQQ